MWQRPGPSAWGNGKAEIKYTGSWSRRTWILAMRGWLDTLPPPYFAPQVYCITSVYSTPEPILHTKRSRIPTTYGRDLAVSALWSPRQIVTRNRLLKGVIAKVAFIASCYLDEGDVLLYTTMSSYIQMREIGGSWPAIPNCRVVSSSWHLNSNIAPVESTLCQH